MKKNIVIIGVVLLALGVVLAALGPALFTTSPEKLAADRDQNNFTYNSYSAGDTVTVYGKITYMHEANILGKKIFSYELNGDGDLDNDGDFTFISYTDVGKLGDAVILKLELQEQNFGITTEYWEATATISPVVYMLPGILIAVIGVIILLVGLVKKDDVPQQPMQTQQYNQYPQQQTPPPAAPQEYAPAPQPEYYQPQEENPGPPRF